VKYHPPRRIIANARIIATIALKIRGKAISIQELEANLNRIFLSKTIY
jgi:hypothetical protein